MSFQKQPSTLLPCCKTIKLERCLWNDFAPQHSQHVERICIYNKYSNKQYTTDHHFPPFHTLCYTIQLNPANIGSVEERKFHTTLTIEFFEYASKVQLPTPCSINVCWTIWALKRFCAVFRHLHDGLLAEDMATQHQHRWVFFGRLFL